MALRDNPAKTIYLKDYQVPEFLIDETQLNFKLYEDRAGVEAHLKLRRNPECQTQPGPLVLHGEDLELTELSLEGQRLNDQHYTYREGLLTVHSVPDSFELRSIVTIRPHENTSLEGLYKSKTMFCSQCEAEGFRKITFYLDRPDVMSCFTTTIEADKALYPVLLSNGNLIDQGESANGRHWVKWFDPFKKPAYLFAVVAGDLSFVEDRFATMSGREVLIKIFVEAKDIGKCDYALDSLKRAMRWDEEVYGREYDLDIFMIVAVDDFNMGAMENKGLNIFNTSCVLASPETTTDAAYQRVEAVVAHEYFHNWSGNRVTCRDWFQLSLKEGFTVFRDAEFSADMGSRVIKRVEDVNFLRARQFAEDNGPTAHPVQPASFMEISNFYTLTIYEKGAEVVRMIHTLLGADLFRQGSDLYFERHDGQAVTIEDFIAAMADVSGRDFSQFMHWYRQAGTPKLSVNGHYDDQAHTYRLDFTQSCSPTAKADSKEPFLIPLKLGLVGKQGDLPLHLQNQINGETECILELDSEHQSITFEGVFEKPTPSLLRGFSAPVKLDFDYSFDQLITLMTKDSDGFNRWNACNTLGLVVINGLIEDYQAERDLYVDNRLIAAYQDLLSTWLKDAVLDPAMLAHMLALPGEDYISETSDIIHVEAIRDVRELVRTTMARELKDLFLAVYKANQNNETYSANADQVGKRSLKNAALAYLLKINDSENIDLANQQFNHSDNMTDTNAALISLLNNPDALAQKYAGQALQSYYQRWKEESLVVNQWFQIQAACSLPGGLERVKELLEHEAFDIKNPNKVRSLIGVFSMSNPCNFHRLDGAGYDFLVDQVLILDKLNPQISSRLLMPLTRWKKYPEQQARAMCGALNRVLEKPGLSKDSYEIASKAIAA